MRTRLVVDLLRVLLAGALLLILLLQVVALPWLSGVMAQELPDAAYMRWPILTLSIFGLACVQLGILCTLRLLGSTRRGEVFSTGALRWVDGLIGAFLAASAVCLATIIYQSFTVAGPPAWTLMLLGGLVTGIGMALLMAVMRSLLVQATTLQHEMETVI